MKRPVRSATYTSGMMPSGITQTLGDDVAWNGRLRLFRQHLPGIDGFLALGMVSRDAGQRSGVPHGNDIRGGSIGMRQRTEMVGAGIADIDHIGLVREVLIIGVTEQSSARALAESA